MTIQTMLIQRESPRGRMIERLIRLMTPLAEIDLFVAGQTSPPIQPHRNAVGLVFPEEGMILGGILLMAGTALGLPMTEQTGGIGG